MIDPESMTPEQQKVWEKVNQMMDVSYGCAESFVAAVGEYLWGEVDESVQRISTGFSGGVGGTHEELCGGVSGAAIILGLLYGRTTNDEALMVRCKRLIAEQRDRFVQEFGTTVCQELRDAQFGADEENPCSAMIAPAAFMLLDILEEEKAREALVESGGSIEVEAPFMSLDEYSAAHKKDDPGVLVQELERKELHHEHRNWIGEQLNSLGDPRKGIGLTSEGFPEISWLKVPAGKVKIERAGDYQVEEFYISQYLLTYQQFQSFLDDPEGFTNPRWWKNLSANDEHKAVPGEQRFVAGNHPRDNVSWYDSVAFCRWMNDRVQIAGDENKSICLEKVREKSWEIRLPTEWEWQMAATGGLTGHLFPWGQDWEEIRAHTKHNQLNQSMAVGMYLNGASPVGALDMSGNVWEWCLNCYEQPENLDLSRQDRRVLRGGSWYHWGSYAQTDMRSRYYPDHRYNAGGLRIACGKRLTE